MTPGSRTQGPLIGTVNDAASVWAAMWRAQVRMGMVPDTMVIEPATALSGTFTVPLAQARAIFAAAYAGVSGLARTVPGPAMPASPGTVCVDGIAGTGTQKMFVLRYTLAPDPGFIGRPFFAAFDPGAAHASGNAYLVTRACRPLNDGPDARVPADPLIDVPGRHSQRAA